MSLFLNPWLATDWANLPLLEPLEAMVQSSRELLTKLKDMKTIRAKANFVKLSPRKLRLIANAVRMLTPSRAIDNLKQLPHRAAQPILQVFLQAMGNAKTAGLSLGDLKTVSLQIQGGPRGPKKADVHAHGARFNRGVRRKQLAHIELVLGVPEVSEVKLAKKEVKNGTES